MDSVIFFRDSLTAIRLCAKTELTKKAIQYVVELLGSKLAFQYRLYRFLGVFKLDDLVIIKAQRLLSCAVKAQGHELFRKIFIQFKLHHFLFFSKSQDLPDDLWLCSVWSPNRYRVPQKFPVSTVCFYRSRPKQFSRHAKSVYANRIGL